MNTTTINGKRATIRGNYKISTDKHGKMIAHKWWRLAMRWVRCDLKEALAAPV